MRIKREEFRRIMGYALMGMELREHEIKSDPDRRASEKAMELADLALTKNFVILLSDSDKIQVNP